MRCYVCDAAEATAGPDGVERCGACAVHPGRVVTISARSAGKSRRARADFQALIDSYGGSGKITSVVIDEVPKEIEATAYWYERTFHFYQSEYK